LGDGSITKLKLPVSGGGLVAGTNGINLVWHGGTNQGKAGTDLSRMPVALVLNVRWR
jgi:hypothetical protein